MTTEKRPLHPARRPIFLGLSAAIALAVVLAAREVLLPFVLALVIAYVLTPAVSFLESKKLHRGTAILAVYGVFLGSVSTFVVMVAPRIGHELRTLKDELPMLTRDAKEKWYPELTAKLQGLGLLHDKEHLGTEGPPPETAQIIARQRPDGTVAIEIGSGIAVTQTHDGYLVEPSHDAKEVGFDPSRAIGDALGKSMVYAKENSLQLVRLGGDIIAVISRSIFIFFITLMLAAYIMITRESVIGTFRSLVRPHSRASFDSLLERIDRGLGGVVRGQLIICLINGILTAIGFGLMGLKYWPVLALAAGVFSLIPIFGSIVSSVPAVAIGLTQGVGTAAMALLWILGIHQLEANVLNPKIMGHNAKIHPVLVIFSLLVGEHFFHAVGALLAVPCMSMALSLFGHFRDVVHDDDPEFATEKRRAPTAPEHRPAA